MLPPTSAKGRPTVKLMAKMTGQKRRTAKPEATDGKTGELLTKECEIITSGAATRPAAIAEAQQVAKNAAADLSAAFTPASP